jgi:hypothetical protein
MFQQLGSVFREFINNKGSKVQRLFHALVAHISIIKVNKCYNPGYTWMWTLTVSQHEIPVGQVLVRMIVCTVQSVNCCEFVTEEADCWVVVLFLQECGLASFDMRNLACQHLKNLNFLWRNWGRLASEIGTTIPRWYTLWGWHLGAEICRNWHLIRSRFCDLFYCILVYFVGLKYGM